MITQATQTLLQFIAAVGVLAVAVASADDQLSRQISLHLNVPAHTADVRSLEFIDNQTLCTGGLDKRINVWRITGGNQTSPVLRHERRIWWDVERGTLGSIYDLAIAPLHPAGPVIVFGGQSCRGGNSETVWSTVADGQQHRYLNAAILPGTGRRFAPTTCVSTTSDGQYVVTTDLSGKTLIWSADGTAKLLFEASDEELPRRTNPLGNPTCCSTIAGDQILVPEYVRTRAVAGLEYPVWRLVQYDLRGETRQTLFGEVEHHVAVTALVASRNGRFVAAADYGENGEGVVHWWDRELGKYQRIPLGDGYAISLGFSESGDRLAIGTEGTRGRKSRLLVIDTASLQPLPVSQNTDAPVVACAVSPQAEWVGFALHGSGSVHVRGIRGAAGTYFPGGPRALAAFPIDPATGRIRIVAAMDEGSEPDAYEFDPTLLQLRKVAASYDVPPEVAGWRVDLSVPQRLRVVRAAYGPRPEEVYLDVPVPGVITSTQWILTADGRLQGVAVGNAIGEIQLYRLRQSTYSRRLSGHSGGITRLSVAKDTRYLISASTDGTVRYWALDGWADSSLAARWGIAFRDEDAALVVQSVDDRGPLYHASLRPGDEWERVVWDNDAAHLQVGEPLRIEGRERHVARTKPEMLHVLQALPHGHQIAIYLRRDGQPVRLPVQTNDDWRDLLAVSIQSPHWIAWNASGYYASSPGGERLIGWLVNGADQIDEQGNADPTLNKPAPAFQLAIQFHRPMYRPDVIQRLIPSGTLQDAMAQAEAERLDTLAQQTAESEKPKVADPSDTPPPQRRTTEPDRLVETTEPIKPVHVVELLPPRVRILAPTNLELTHDQRTLVIEAEAVSDRRRPVKSMQLLVNSGPDSLSIRELNPLSGIAQRGLVREVKYPAQRWEVTLGEGMHEFVVRADCGEGEQATYGLSEAIRVTFKNSRANMYVLAVGISDYPGELKLRYAHLDATGFVATLQRHAEGDEQPYETVTAKLLTNAEATRENLLEGLNWLQSQLKRGDLGVVFFAGHGMRDPNGNAFHLLPVDANIDDLATTAISQVDIRRFCSETSGDARRLLVIDACYSGALDPAESFRDLNSDDFGVFVMTSSQDDERSWELDDLRGGVFTSWLNRGLAGGAKYGDEYVDDWDLGKYVQTTVSGFVRERFERSQTPLFLRPQTSMPFYLTKPVEQE
jgi:WD40 repeat protein